MKRIVCVLVLVLVLSGCSAPVYETMGNVVHVSDQDELLRPIKLALSADAAVLTASGTDLLYSCSGYSISLQTLPSGDLPATIRTISGYEPEQLTLVHSTCGDHSRYDWVWVAAGEEGEVLCRAAVLDDGHHHYSLCAYADADAVAELTELWNALFASFCLEDGEEV